MFFLYGAGGHAKVILDILRARNVAVDFVCDDNPALTEFCGLPVARTCAVPAGATAIVSIGRNETRRKIADALRGNVAAFATAVHPSAVVSPESEIGAGTVVMPGALVNAGTRVGEHCIVNTGASVDHDCRVGDFAHISPHATLCGNVSVGEGSWIGAGTVVIQGVSIGKNCLIGAGSVVSKDIPDNSFACGNRCKILKTNNPPPVSREMK